MILELKKKNYHHKSPIFLKDVGIEKLLVFNKISSDEKNYKYFIDYLATTYNASKNECTCKKL